jgi:RNA polymerase sigma factor (sigma-70 family)
VRDQHSPGRTSGSRPGRGGTHVPPAGYDLKAEFSQAYHDYASDVRRHALRAAFGDRATADDATQEAFIAAYDHWRSFREMPPGRQRAWLSTAARNKIIDSWRRTSSEDPVDDLPEPVDSCISEDAPASIDVAIFWKQITMVIPPRAAQAAYLAWNEGWNNAEIARHLGIHPATVARDLRMVIAEARRPGFSASITAGNEGGES